MEIYIVKNIKKYKLKNYRINNTYNIHYFTYIYI